jgi:hypothetical protein
MTVLLATQDYIIIDDLALHSDLGSIKIPKLIHAQPNDKGVSHFAMCGCLSECQAIVDSYLDNKPYPYKEYNSTTVIIEKSGIDTMRVKQLEISIHNGYAVHSISLVGSVLTAGDGSWPLATLTRLVGRDLVPKKVAIMDQVLTTLWYPLDDREKLARNRGFLVHDVAGDYTFEVDLATLITEYMPIIMNRKLEDC